MIPPKPPNTCWEGCCWLLLPKPKNLVEVLGAGAETAAAAGAAPPTPPVKAT